MKNVILMTAAALILIGLSVGAVLIAAVPKAENIPEKAPEAVLPEKKEEIRGVWIATVGNIDFPSRQGLSADELRSELDAIVDNTCKAGLNSIFFQVRPSSDAFYDSDIFPASVYISGTQGQSADLDILGYLVEAAADKNIKVFAWINPMRVTASAELYTEDGVTVFAESNPAGKRPDLLFGYDSLLYYDIGKPEARRLIASGVYEVAEKYDVAGIVFDDYFYPYPKEGQTLSDGGTFGEYGEGFDDIADWRRNNVNLLVRECYDAVKTADANKLFGISPFGIWRNDDGVNGGSATHGLEAYDEIYCDALAWVRGGYVDLICPQIYWNIGYPAADYAKLVDWWSKALDGHDGVTLLIGHAMYKISLWESENEIYDQIAYARTAGHYGGSVFYGYGQIKENERGAMTILSRVYRN